MVLRVRRLWMAAGWALLATVCVAWLPARSIDAWVPDDEAFETLLPGWTRLPCACSGDSTAARYIGDQADALWHVHLRDDVGRVVVVDLAYYRTRGANNRLIYHLDSINCLQGNYRTLMQSHLQKPDGLALERLVLRRRDETATVYYWLQSPGKVSTDYLSHGAWLYWLDVIGRPSSGFFVRISHRGLPDEETEARVFALAGGLQEKCESLLEQ